MGEKTTYFCDGCKEDVEPRTMQGLIVEVASTHPQGSPTKLRHKARSYCSTCHASKQSELCRVLDQVLGTNDSDQ